MSNDKTRVVAVSFAIYIVILYSVLTSLKIEFTIITFTSLILSYFAPISNIKVRLTALIATFISFIYLTTYSNIDILILVPSLIIGSFAFFFPNLVMLLFFVENLGIILFNLNVNLSEILAFTVLYPILISNIYLVSPEIIEIPSFLSSKIVIKVSNVPQSIWPAIVDDKPQLFSQSKVTLPRDTKYIIFCPFRDSGKYYIPSISKVYFTSNKKRYYISVKYNVLNSFSLTPEFKECVVTFIENGLPSGIPWSIEFNGETYSSSEDKIYVLTPFDGYRSWKTFTVNDGSNVYVPNPSKGIAKRGETIVVNFSSTMASQTKPQVIPSLMNWDPSVWIGKKLYGYSVISIIGKGGNGYVLKAQLGGKDYAVKVFSFYPSTSGTLTVKAKRSFEEIYNESSNLRKLSEHPHIVKIYGIHIDLNVIEEILKGDAKSYYENPPAIIMEFMEGGSVDKLLQNPTIIYSSYWPMIVKEIIKEVASALEYIHNNGYVHLDVKPQNIFANEKLGSTGEEVYKKIIDRIKLGDLGSAVKIGGRIEQATPYYCPPEQIEAMIYGKGADPKMDIFALGMTGYVLLSQNMNPAGDLLDKAIDSYLQGRVNETINYLAQAKSVLASWMLNLPPNTPSELVEVIRRSINVNPNQRPSASDILRILG